MNEEPKKDGGAKEAPVAKSAGDAIQVECIRKCLFQDRIFNPGERTFTTEPVSCCFKKV